MDQMVSKGSVFLENAPELTRLLENIFTNDFTQERTRFEGFEGFRHFSTVAVDRKADTLTYAPSLLDAFVKESTDLATWGETVRSATGLRYHRQRLFAVFQYSLQDPSGPLLDGPSER